MSFPDDGCLNGKVTYTISRQNEDWWKAGYSCNDIGAKLVSIESTEEQNRIESMLRSK